MRLDVRQAREALHEGRERGLHTPADTARVDGKRAYEGDAHYARERLNGLDTEQPLTDGAYPADIVARAR